MNRVNIALRIIIPLLILAGGWLVMKQFASKKEEPVRRSYRLGNVPRVNAVEIRRSDFKVIITSNGVVRAHNSTMLSSRVSGRIERITPLFENGAFFKKDDVLAELDPTDFDAAVAAAEARVARAEAELAQQKARAEQALLDWADLGNTDPPSDLVKRVPQMKEATANLTAALADLTAAQRDIDRAKILAPYDGCVLSRQVGPGQSVGPGTSLGEVFSTDHAEIRLPLSAAALKYFQLPEADPSLEIKATLYDALTEDSALSWNGTVIRTEGALNTTSRELFVITEVKDPFGLNSDHAPLRIGHPVRAEIEGRTLKDVFVLPREGMRSPTEIVLVNPEDSTIQRTTVEPIWDDKEHIIVRDPLPEGWLLIVSQLPYAANGSRVEIVEPDTGEEGLKAAQGPTEENTGG